MGGRLGILCQRAIREPTSGIPQMGPDALRFGRAAEVAAGGDESGALTNDDIRSGDIERADGMAACYGISSLPLTSTGTAGVGKLPRSILSRTQPPALLNSRRSCLRSTRLGLVPMI